MEVEESHRKDKKNTMNYEWADIWSMDAKNNKTRVERRIKYKEALFFFLNKSLTQKASEQSVIKYRFFGWGSCR